MRRTGIYRRYGYGAACIPMPSPARYRTAPEQRWWYCHPSLAGLFGSLLIMSMLRSCATPVVEPGRTLVWLRQASMPKPHSVIKTEKQVEKKAVSEPPPVMIKPKAQPVHAHLMLNRSKPLVETAPSVESMLTKRQKERHSDVVDRKPVLDEPVIPDSPRQLNVMQKQAVLPGESYSLSKRPKASVLPAQDSIEILTPAQKQGNHLMRDPVVGLPDAQTVTPSEGLTFLLASADNRKASPRVIANPAPGTGENGFLPKGGTVGLPVGRYSGDSLKSKKIIAKKPGDIITDTEVPSGVTAPAGMKQREVLPPEDMVVIDGTIDGESTRVRYLKQAIYKKALGMAPDGGTYCCRIGTVDCKVDISKARRVSLFFSRGGVLLDVISFEVASKLERLLPKGARPCAD